MGGIPEPRPTYTVQYQEVISLQGRKLGVNSRDKVQFESGMI
jgi:hypothetical protein